MPDIPMSLAEIEKRISAIRENLTELEEQAAAYSGAAVEELNAQRIADQDARLQQLFKQRDELLQSTSSAAKTANRVKPHMQVIGADGVHIGTVDRVENGRIRLTKADGGEGRHKGHNHFIDLSLVAAIEGQKVRLSA